MEVAEKHRYAAAALAGISILGESALLFEMSAITVFYASLVGGVAGVYLYAYSQE